MALFSVLTASQQGSQYALLPSQAVIVAGQNYCILNSLQLLVGIHETKEMS